MGGRGGGPLGSKITVVVIRSAAMNPRAKHVRQHDALSEIARGTVGVTRPCVMSRPRQLVPGRLARTDEGDLLHA